MQKIKKKQVKKLSLGNHVLYVFIYSILFLLGFSLPIVILLRDHVFLRSPEMLAYSTGFGVLWIIPSMGIAVATTAYFGWTEKHTIPVKNAIVGLFKKTRSILIVVVCIVLFVVSFFLAFYSNRYEFRSDGFYKCSIFETKKIGNIESVENVEWFFDSTYVSNGRYGSNQTSLTCVIYLKGEKISFDRFELQSLPTVAHILKNAPQEILNEHLLEGWLLSLDCESSLQKEIRQIFSP